MQAFHNTSNIVCRDPKGAVELGTSATIRIFAWDDDVQSVTLRLWQEYGPESSPEAQALSGEKRVVMQKSDFADALPTGVPDYAQCFEAIVKPAATGLIWYRFELQASDGAVWSYGAQENRCTGVGSFAYGEPPSFQITCYEPRGSKGELSTRFSLTGLHEMQTGTNVPSRHWLFQELGFLASWLKTGRRPLSISTTPTAA